MVRAWRHHGDTCPACCWDYGCGVAGKRNVVLTTALTFLIAGTLWAIIDMDHPRKGFIRVGQQPMLDLKNSLDRSGSGPTR
jgi:hypothetical protein